MGKPKSTTDAQELAAPLQLARLQLTKAERNLEAARERSRLAKRRRKEAKEAARRARKGVKQAKIELAEARDALARAEAEQAKVRKPPVRKQRKAAHPAADARSQPQMVQKPVPGAPREETRPALTPAPPVQPGGVNPKPPSAPEVSITTQKTATQSSGLSAAEGSEASGKG